MTGVQNCDLELDMVTGLLDVHIDDEGTKKIRVLYILIGASEEA